MQKYYGLDVTGEADSATLNLMKKKRCGAKDMEYGKSKKHFVGFFAVLLKKTRHNVENFIVSGVGSIYF